MLKTTKECVYFAANENIKLFFSFVPIHPRVPIHPGLWYSFCSFSSSFLYIALIICKKADICQNYQNANLCKNYKFMQKLQIYAKNAYCKCKCKKLHIYAKMQIYAKCL